MRALALALVLFAVPTVASARALSRWVIAATYLNDPAHEAQADRLRAELDRNGIVSVTTCSAGCSLSVDRTRYLDALRIGAAFVAAQHLDIAIVVPGTS
jgi:hypothetical protein